jgi:hypothetical protein
MSDREGSMPRRLATVLVTSTLLFAIRAVAAAAEVVPEAPAEQKARKPSFAAVPGPFYNPNQGLGLMVIGMGMFQPSQNDTVSPPSIVALVGMVR